LATCAHQILQAVCTARKCVGQLYKKSELDDNERCMQLQCIYLFDWSLNT